MKKKRIPNLDSSDFDDFAVWIPFDENDDDSFDIVPCKTCSLLNDEAIYFVAARFCFADSSEYPGYVRVTCGSVKQIGVSVTEKFYEFPVNKDLRIMTGISANSFALEIGKLINDVFPIRYQTKFHFTNGAALRGLIEI